MPHDITPLSIPYPSPAVPSRDPCVLPVSIVDISIRLARALDALVPQYEPADATVAAASLRAFAALAAELSAAYDARGIGR